MALQVEAYFRPPPMARMAPGYHGGVEEALMQLDLRHRACDALCGQCGRMGRRQRQRMRAGNHTCCAPTSFGSSISSAARALCSGSRVGIASCSLMKLGRTSLGFTLIETPAAVPFASASTWRCGSDSRPGPRIPFAARSAFSSHHAQRGGRRPFRSPPIRICPIACRWESGHVGESALADA